MSAIQAFLTTKILGLYFYFSASRNYCEAPTSFFGFPTWHKYLEHRAPVVEITGSRECSPHIENINDVWLIGLAAVEILLRVGVIVAIVYVMLGGMKYVNARGNAEKTDAAKKTITDALLGLVITVSAVAVVSFIGGRFSQ